MPHRRQKQSLLGTMTEQGLIVLQDVPWMGTRHCWLTINFAILNIRFFSFRDAKIDTLERSEMLCRRWQIALCILKRADYSRLYHQSNLRIRKTQEEMVEFLWDFLKNTHTHKSTFEICMEMSLLNVFLIKYVYRIKAHLDENSCKNSF